MLVRDDAHLHPAQSLIAERSFSQTIFTIMFKYHYSYIPDYSSMCFKCEFLSPGGRERTEKPSKGIIRRKCA